jgi:hypothetical protein
MANSEQLGFGFEQIEEEKATAHLPSEIEAGIVAYRGMLGKNNEAMLAGDEGAATPWAAPPSTPLSSGITTEAG